jgi:hypothetical protein
VSVERDPTLERLFAAADRDLADEAFVAGVMARANHRRRRKLMAIVIAVCLVAVPAAWWVVGPFNEALQSFSQVLLQPLAETGNGLPAPILAPVNSIAGALVLGLLALRAIVRRLLS